MFKHLRPAVVAVIMGVGLVTGVATSPAASASQSHAAPNTGWTTIAENNAQTFTYHDTSVPGPAILSGFFTWTADFNARLESRHYTTPNSGTHTIHLGPAAHCTSGEHITVELFAEAFPFDESFGTRSIVCATGGNAVFTAIPPDTYYFVLTAGSFGVTPNRTLSGTTTYP